MVVVRVLSAEVCRRTVDAMFDDINAEARRKKCGSGEVSPSDPATWHAAHWPSRSKFLIRRPAFHPQAFSNRTCDALYTVFRHLWNEERLQVTIDNWGVVRGTRQIPVVNPKTGQTTREDRPKWGAGLRPHWDYNPWLFAKEQQNGHHHGYQGLLALEDHNLDIGCHRTLPGGAPFLAQWSRERVCPKSLGMKRASHRPAPDDSIRDWMQAIPIRQGDLSLWSWGQLHGSTQNNSSQMRLHQFIRMYPAPEANPFYAHHDRYAPARILHQYPEERAALECLDLRARRLLGLQSW